MKQRPETFLVEGKEPRTILLACLPWYRSSVIKIAEGENPDNFLRKATDTPTWGILYITDEELGFFVHPSDSQMAILFKPVMSDAKFQEIHFHIKFDSITTAEFIHPEQKKGLARIFSWFLPKEDAVFNLAWRPSSDTTEYRLIFTTPSDITEFEETLRAVIPGHSEA